LISRENKYTIFCRAAETVTCGGYLFYSDVEDRVWLGFVFFHRRRRAVISRWGVAMSRDVRWRHRQGGEKEREHLWTSRTRWRTESCLRLTVELDQHYIHITSSPPTQLHPPRRR